MVIRLYIFSRIHAGAVIYRLILQIDIALKVVVGEEYLFFLVIAVYRVLFGYRPLLDWLESGLAIVAGDQVGLQDGMIWQVVRWGVHARR